MLSAQPSQFTLSDAGEILYQATLNNPVPGTPVATLTKGDNILQPLVTVLDGTENAEQVKPALENWLKAHVVQVLEPLIALLDDAPEGEEVKQHVKDIMARVFKSLGIVPREDLQSLIAELDADDRRVLRSKKIKLGPVLVFQPDLNKPAAVRLRALLFSLYNDKPLPAPVPKDGVVSQKVEGEVDAEFFQAIGYPVFGPRAIRIDMLDRVISAVYDSADKGKFQAQHSMAEWLGCGIEDLYAVLTAMGHSKTYDPADEVKAKEEAAAVEEKPAAEVPSQETAKEENAEAAKEVAPKEVKPQEKPTLATFALKRGKAFEKGDQKSAGGKKPFKKKTDKRDDKKKLGKRNKTTNRAPKVMSAEAKQNPEDNPFAALAQLKGGSNAG